MVPKRAEDGATDNMSWRAGLIGESPAIQETCDTLQKLRYVDSTVLILVNQETGKEVVARALHRSLSVAKVGLRRLTVRHSGNLLESELFGHKRGAFTDAKADRKGIFEVCSRGTLLIDEIGDMPLGLQTKLLRVLQERQIMQWVHRVG